MQVKTIGHEKQPLIIVDGFCPDPGSLIDYALQQQDVRPASGFYPGMRSSAPTFYKDFLTEQLGPVICDTFSLAKEQLQSVDSYYSMVTTPLKDLQLVQRIPHFDQPDPSQIALLHYLCSERHGGTSFYRHRQTGYEYVDQHRTDGYFRRLESDISHYGVPQEYINGNTALFERIESIPVRYNRLLIYRCSSLHSGNIPADYGFDFNPRSGRFTIASFMHG